MSHLLDSYIPLEQRMKGTKHMTILKKFKAVEAECKAAGVDTTFPKDVVNIVQRLSLLTKRLEEHKAQVLAESTKQQAVSASQPVQAESIVVKSTKQARNAALKEMRKQFNERT